MQSDNNVHLKLFSIMYFQNDNEGKAMLAIQKKIIRAGNRVKVTMCLYFTLSNRARSLPTLIALIVNREMAVNMVKLKVTMAAV